MLNDLFLECSICLEGLGTSSKVLPCQHTFCKECLEDIVIRYSELCCPECRVLVNVQINDLPSNVTLKYIFEAMDENTLNNILKCSVCLVRFGTSSKVLPCQHTFCKKCLEEIVIRHGELRCPKCRVLVNVKINNLPPNVTLMRYLEGLKSVIPKEQ